MLTRSTTTESCDSAGVDGSVSTAGSTWSTWSTWSTSGTAVGVFAGAEEEEPDHEQQHGPAPDREVHPDRRRGAEHRAARDRDERIHRVELEQPAHQRTADEPLDRVHRARHVDQDAEEVREHVRE